MSDAVMIFAFDDVVFGVVPFDDPRVGSAAPQWVEDFCDFFDRDDGGGGQVLRGKSPPGQWSDGV